MAQIVNRKAKLQDPGLYVGQPAQHESATLLNPGAWHLHDIEQIKGSKGTDEVWLSADSALSAKINLGKGHDLIWLTQADGFELSLKGVEFIGAAAGQEGADLRVKGAASFRTDGSIDLATSSGDKARQTVTFDNLRADTAINLGAGKDSVIFASGFSLGMNADGELLARKDGYTLTFTGYPASHNQLTIVIDGVSHSYRELLASGTLNAAPVIQEQTSLGSIVEGRGSFRFGVEDLLERVSDPDGDSLQILDVWLDNADAGTLQRQADGSWLAQPALGFHGDLQIAFKVSDAINSPVTGTAGLTVMPNSSPVIEAQTSLGSMVEGGEGFRFGVEDLLERLSDPDGDSLQILDVWLDNADAGTLQRQADGSWLAQPALGFHGDLQIAFKVSDGISSPVTGTAGLTVMPNSTPVIEAQTSLGSMVEGGEGFRFGVEDLLEQVSDPDGDSLQILGVWLDNADAGTLQRQADGSWLLQPALGFHGDLQIVFQVSDGISSPVSGLTSVQVTEIESFPSELMQQAQARSFSITDIHYESLLDETYQEVRTLALSLHEPGRQWTSDITYSFNLHIPQDYRDNNLDLPEWQPYPDTLWAETHEVMQAFDELVAIAVEFATADADIRFNSLDTLSEGYNGYAIYPGYWPHAGDVFLSRELGALDSVEVGSYGFKTIIHELGHAVGLKHPFEKYEILPIDVDHRVNTLMSYTDYRAWSPALYFTDNSYGISYQDVYAETFMVYDMAALHYLYGPETSTRAGDDTYVLNERNAYQTLWDAGGIDTLDLSQINRSNIIDLNPGAYSTLNYRSAEDWIALLSDAAFAQLGWVDEEHVRNAVEDRGDRLYTGEQALGIAYGTVIENAMGGSAADVFFDNLADNILWGNEGDDFFELGAGGFDTIFGGDGFDTVSVAVSRDGVSLAQSGGEILLVADTFAVRMVGVEDIRFATDGTWV